MAGRRWAQGRPEPSDDGNRHLRPSERGRGAAKPPSTRVTRREQERAERAAAAANRPAPSPEAIARAKERLAPPKAPWHPLPLAELAIVIGFLVMFITFVMGNVEGAAAGFALTLGGVIEFSWREHRHGYRSHGAVLGGVLGIAAAAISWRFVGLTRAECAGVGFVVFLVMWGAFTKTYLAKEDREAAAAAADD